MKICYLANATVVNTHTHRWINYFAEHGWKVDLITWRKPAYSEIHPDITVHHILFPPHYIARYGALLEIACLLRKIRPDIIHAHYLSHFGILAGLYARLSGFRPIVLTAWGSDVLVDAKGWKKQLIKYALKGADCITCEGQNVREALIELGAEPNTISHILWAADTEKFNPQRRSEKLRRELGILDSPAIISSKGLEPVYAIESLVKSVPIVLKEVPEAKFVIAGKGSQEAELKGLAKSLGVSDSIRFVGWIPSDEFPKYVASADIYVCTSLSDGGFALSTKEAMACGLPVVVTDFGDNSKWVKDGINGFVVPLKSPEALASKIIYLLRNKEDRIKFGQANRQMIEEKANWEKEMGRVEKLYEELIGRYKK